MTDAQTPAVDEAKERKKKAAEERAAAVAPIRSEVLQILGSCKTAMTQIATMFAGVNEDKAAKYYAKKAAAFGTMMAWYDPDAKKKAKIERLKAQLAALEAEEGAG